MLSRFPRLIDRRTVLHFAAALAGVSLLLPASALCAWQRYTSADGLVNDYVNSILVDHLGNLWFGTNYGYGGGVSRFDGVTWTTYSTEDGLADPWIRTMAEDRSGNVWIACSTGVSRFDGHNWQTFTTGDGLALGGVSSIAADRKGQLWFGTSGGGVIRYDGSSWKGFTTADGLASNNVWTIAEDSAGNVWFGFAGPGGIVEGVGVSRFDGASWKTFTTADGLAGNDVRSIFRDGPGNLWFGTTSGGVSRFDGTNWRSFTTADGLAGNSVFAITEDRSGNVWFGTDAGLSRFNGAGWRAFTTADGLAYSTVSAVAADSSGNLWLGFTDYCCAFSATGVQRFDGTTWTTMPFGFGFPGGYSLLADRSGGLWLGTYGNDACPLRRFDGTTWTTFTSATGLGGDNVLAMADDHSGNVWVGTNSGVSRFDGQNWTTFGPPGTAVTAITEDHSGHVWIGTQQAVMYFNGDYWNWVETQPEAIRSMEFDRSGNLWVVDDYKGLRRFDGSNWRSFTAADGFTGVYPTSVAVDSTGAVWVGCQDGLIRFDGTSWRQFTTADGLTSDLIGRILVDHMGHLWVGTAALNRFDGIAWSTFTTNDGLPDNGIVAITQEPSGSLWFLTGTAVVRYEQDVVSPRTVFATAPSPVTTSRALTATFVAAFGETQGVQFSSRLDGGPWSTWAAVGSWTQAAIPDGVHKLEARSRDKSDNVEATPASVTFEIDATPPAPIIASPTFGQVVRGRVEIRGIAADARFGSFKVEARPAGVPSWDPPDAALIAQSSSPVAGGLLATWDTASLPDGNYDLRVAVSDSLGLVGVAQVTVTVDNHTPYADVTAPARVPAASGGDIYTTNSELHLYFPPHAFDEDAVVAVTSASAPDTLPSGAVRVEPAYDVSWSSSPLVKPAILEFSTAGRAPASGTLAIYSAAAGGSWQRLGGTQEQGKVSLAIRGPGRYALVAETAPAQGSSELSSISFTPRVFSVSNHFANDQVAIGFTLGRSAPVTVRIYNRAGRLVRDVVEGRVMDVGSNLVRWNGTDRADVPVADGIYLVTVQALGETRRSTIAVVR